MDVLIFYVDSERRPGLFFWTPTTLLSPFDLAYIWISTTACILIDLGKLFWTLVFCLVNWNLIMSVKKCCVPNCNKSRADDTILHLFPNPDKNMERFQHWRNAIGGEILLLDHQTVFECRRVCHSHFEPQYHTRSKRLSPAAVPTLYLQDVLSRQPLGDISNQANRNDSVSQVYVPTPSTSRHPPVSTFKQPPTDQQPSFEQPAASTFEQPAGSSLKQATSKGESQVLKNSSPEFVTLSNKIKKLQKSKDSVMTRLKKALKLSENIAFQRALKSFTAAAVIFTMLQFREVGKKITGRRFNKNEKVMALALYKQGPRAYRWLRKIFVLPSPLTLSRMIARASLKPGLNKNVFAQLKKKVEKMTNNERLCVLLFDEVSIKPHFDYNRRKDCISGFVNDGEKIKEHIADHALVFMLRGIQKNYKQPIAYSFCAGSTPKMELAMQIKKIIKKLNAIGFKVMATICDQGATNVSAINYLINETHQEHIKQNKDFKNKVFEIDGNEVIPLYDPPHLIKGIRNNLLSKNLKAVINGKEKTAQWEHILQLYKEDEPYQGLRLLPRLTENHVVQKKIFKMKVKCATQVFSSSVAAHMRYLARKGILSKECEETADILYFFDNLFDSVNGSYDNSKKRSGKPLLGAVTPKSRHRMVWRESKNVLKSMKFIYGNNTNCASVPSIANWLLTIENVEYLVDVLSKKFGLTSVWMRHLNQDPLENFFGCIRSHGYRNVSPTCAGFEAAFASLLINNMSGIHSKGSNCEEDSCTVFKSLNKLFFKKPETSVQIITELDFEDVNCDHVFINLDRKRGNPKIRAQLDYVTGYVLRKLKVKSCTSCKECFYSSNEEESSITIKEYFSNKRCLTYPSMPLIQCFSHMQDIVTSIIKKDCKKQNIRQYIKTMFSIVMDYSFIKCNIHKIEIIQKLEDLTINLFLYSWCKSTNKILNGNRTDFDRSDKIQELAFKYCKKRSKYK